MNQVVKAKLSSVAVATRMQTGPFQALRWTSSCDSRSKSQSTTAITRLTMLTTVVSNMNPKLGFIDGHFNATPPRNPCHAPQFGKQFVELPVLTTVRLSEMLLFVKSSTRQCRVGVAARGVVVPAVYWVAAVLPPSWPHLLVCFSSFSCAAWPGLCLYRDSASHRYRGISGCRRPLHRLCLVQFSKYY